MYYFILVLGFLFVIMSVIVFIFMYVEKEYPFLNVVKTVFGFLFGIFLLVVTLPSLKYFIQKDYDVISGNCTIEVSSSGRSAEATFNMIDTNEQYYFSEIPSLDAYGKSIPYYCKVTVTKDHIFEIGYEIYDVKSRKLILKND
ncbi:hypothetical protein ACFVT8_07965 [Lysinibacillus sp. NPDC058147]|uniref:hypothetical protein n=1 Tax=unclassified Lysinibacillus TaxID=2636778 RepID=UPI0036D98E9A